MKNLLRIGFVLLMATAFTGCFKNNDNFVASNPVVGSWVINSAERGDNYGWYQFASGLETGILDFYNHGSAEYTEHNLSLTGNWYIGTSNGSYYDEYGNYRTGPHQTMSVRLYDSYSGSSIDLNFDYVTFSNNSFIGTDYYAGSVERYQFVRY